jgi:hypothetical protein
MEAIQVQTLSYLVVVPPDDRSRDDCQALLKHHDHDDSDDNDDVPPMTMVEAWATPALHDLNSEIFESYSQAQVHAVMQKNASRIDDDHLARFKCVASSNDNDTKRRMTGIGNEQVDEAHHHHRELVTVILTVLLVECVWLVWFFAMPYSAMMFLLFFRPAFSFKRVEEGCQCKQLLLPPLC